MRRLLVSIHDVTPAHDAAVRALWALCREHRVTPALLVVPDWHGRWPLAKSPAFVAWVRGRVTQGAEVMLHGERHDERGLRRGPVDALRAFGRTDGEGEFLTLRRAAAEDRIARGLALLRALDLAPVGFVPPAWLMRRDTVDAARVLGLRVTEDDGAVHDLRRARRLPSPAVRWSGRGVLRAHLSARVADARWRWQRDAELVRVALHPGDLAHPATAASVAEHLSRWAMDRHVVRYADVVA